MLHYTNKAGYNGIRSAKDWLFRAGKPLSKHPKGAYFTTLSPQTLNIASRLRVSNAKVKYLFSFDGDTGLQMLTGPRGKYVFYSPKDYLVVAARRHKGFPKETGL